MPNLENTPVFLSLIIPIRACYDRLATLLNTFDDALLTNFEVIVVRDHDDPPPSDFVPPTNIRVIVAESKGLGPARNFGLQHATGVYVAFCDGDDALDLVQLLDVAYKMDNAGCDLTLAAYEKIHHNEIVTRHDPSRGLEPGVVVDFIDRGRMTGGFYFCWNKIYRRDFLSAINLTYPSGEYEDVYWSVLAIANASKIYISDQSFYSYNQLSTSAVNRSGGQHLDIIRQYKAAIGALEDANIPTVFIQVVWMKATRHILYVICKTNRLGYKDRRTLFDNLYNGLRNGPGVLAVFRMHNLSNFNKLAILLRAPVLLECKRILIRQR